MKKLVLTSALVCCVFLAALAVSVTAAIAPAPVLAPSAEQVPEVALDPQWEDALGLLPKAPLCEVEEDVLFAAQAYECPHNLPYCWKDSDCVSFCGSGFENCDFGCCYCLG